MDKCIVICANDFPSKVIWGASHWRQEQATQLCAQLQEDHPLNKETGSYGPIVRYHWHIVDILEDD